MLEEIVVIMLMVVAIIKRVECSKGARKCPERPTGLVSFTFYRHFLSLSEKTEVQYSAYPYLSSSGMTSSSPGNLSLGSCLFSCVCLCLAGSSVIE